MPEGQVLEFSRATKRFGAVAAVSDFSARIEPGVVTGFLGPNGAGKTTSLRMLLGLIRPTSGSATIGGKRYSELKRPLQTVGAALEAASFHPGRSGANHLKVYARAAGIANTRIDEVLGLVGLADAAGRKVGGYSLGMRQRLGLATALLGDPGVVVLDEPANGLDPEGIRWMRGFLRQLAAEGRTVLISSHVLGEVQQTAHSLLIIARGQRVFQGALWELSDADEHAVVVDSPDRAALVEALRTAGLPFEVLRAGLTIRGADTAVVGAVAAESGVALSTLHKRGPALEEVFLELVNGVRVHPSAQAIAGSLEARALEDAAVEADAAAETHAPADGEAGAVAEPRPAVSPATGSDPATEADAAETHAPAEAGPVAEPEPEPEASPAAGNDPATLDGGTPAEAEGTAPEVGETVLTDLDTGSEAGIEASAAEETPAHAGSEADPAPEQPEIAAEGVTEPASVPEPEWTSDPESESETALPASDAADAGTIESGAFEAGAFQADPSEPDAIAPDTVESDLTGPDPDPVDTGADAAPEDAGTSPEPDVITEVPQAEEAPASEGFIDAAQPPTEAYSWEPVHDEASGDEEGEQR